MLEALTTMTTIRDQAGSATTATTRSIRRRTTMRTTTSPTIQPRVHTRHTAHSQTTTGKMRTIALFGL
jgi:hypothetical protein